MKLLLDQGLPRGASQKLDQAGFDTVHAADVGLSSATDEAVLDWAIAHGRVVATLDADFHAILAQRAAAGPSVIRIRAEGLRDDALASLLVRVLTICEDDLTRGAAVSVDDTGSAPRVRQLPL